MPITCFDYLCPCLLCHPSVVFHCQPTPCLLEVKLFPLWRSAKADLTYWLNERSVAFWIDHLCSFKQLLSSSSISRTKPCELDLHINLQNFQLTVLMINLHSYMQLVPHTFAETDSNYYLWQDQGQVKGWTTGEQIRREWEGFKRLWKSSGNLTRERYQPFFLTYFYILFQSILSRNSISWQNNWTKVGLV